MIHEFSHIRRWDHVTNLLQQFAEIVLLFHSFVWNVSRQLRIDRELCCDSAVISSGHQPGSYAEILLKVACISRPRSLVPDIGVSVSGNPSQLRIRILRLAGDKDGCVITPNRPILSMAVILLVGLLVVSTQQFASAEQGQDASLDSAQARAYLQKARSLPSAIQSIRFRYTDDSDFQHEYSLYRNKWRVDTRFRADAQTEPRRYLEAISFDGSSLRLALALPNTKRLLLTANSLDQLPIGISAPINPMLLVYSWLVPPTHRFCWQDALSDEIWNTAIERMRFVKDGKVGHREAVVFKLSHGHVVHNIWFSITGDVIPLKCQSVDLLSRSITTWEVAELSELTNGAHLPTSLMITTDDLPLQQVRIDVPSIELEGIGDGIDFRVEFSNFAAVLKVDDEDFASKFFDATGDILPVGTSKQSGTQSLDFAYNMGRLSGTDEERANDKTLESIADWDVSTIESVELGNNRGITDQGLRYLRQFRSMKVLYLYRTGIKGPGLVQLVGMPNLNSISLQATDLSDAGMEQLGRMPRLTWLNLAGTRISDAGIVHLANLPSLETLTLDDTNITDLSAATLAKLSSLRRLNVTRSKITADGIQALKTDLPDCAISTGFHLGKTRSTELLFPRGYVPSADEINTRFRELGIEGKVDVDPVDRSTITGLRVFGVTWSSNVFLQLVEFMPELRMLNTRRTFIDDELLQEMDLPKLEYLDLMDSLITDEGFQHVARLSNLREIYLDGTVVTDRGIEYLEGLPHLGTAGFNQNTITLEGFHRIRDLIGAKSIRRDHN